MSDDHILADLVRFFMSVGALLLAVIVIRVGWSRRDTPTSMPFELFLSYAVGLFLFAALRLGHIGDAPTWDLWVALAAVILGWVGVLRKVKINWHPLRQR